ncbi:hypothetical protein [Enterobacillus tribolii]|nr:hypothetical protein [Enterobacillus tribolii]MBW7984480.1 hypothetical protein [Enterobacillus tribolii]
MKRKMLFPLACAAFSSSFACTVLADDATDILIDRAARPAFTTADTYKPGTAAASGAEKAAVPAAADAQKSDGGGSVLPFWGDEARAQGYDLPEPFGINVNYMNIRQNIDVDSIRFSGLGLGSGNSFTPLPSELFDISVGHTRERSKTETLKLDAWVLPFMNIYGLVGYTKGSSVSKVSVDSDPSKFSGNFLNTIISRVIHNMNQSGQLKDLDFTLDFKGVTYGAGTVLAGGYKNWFFLTDINYTQTRFDILDGSIDAFTVSPRVGYKFDIPEMPALHLGPTKLSVWVGSMYQDVQQEFRGSLSDLNMPAELQQLMKLADSDGKGRFKVKQHLESPWNVLLGTQYEITRNFNVATEFGFADRNSFFVSAEYRF